MRVLIGHSFWPCKRSSEAVNTYTRVYTGFANYCAGSLAVCIVCIRMRIIYWTHTHTHTHTQILLSYSERHFHVILTIDVEKARCIKKLK